MAIYCTMICKQAFKQLVSLQTDHNTYTHK